MLFARMLRAARFDRRLYEELRRDPIAVPQALAVLLFAVLAVIVGRLLDALVSDRGLTDSIINGLIVMPGIWLLPATSLFLLGGLAVVSDPERGSNRDLTIAIGFSAAPSLLWLLFFVPGLRYAIPLLALAWTLASMIYASRAMLQVSLMKVLFFLAPGLILLLIIYVAIAARAS